MKPNDLTQIKNISKQIRLMKKTAVKVGLPTDVGQYPNGQSILEVGQRHEFGLGVPRRSFIRVPFAKETPKIQKSIKDGYKNIINGGDTIKNLNKLGIIGQNISRNSFKNQGYGEWKDIKESTKEAKGSSKILFDTGKLVQSVQYWIVKE